MHIPDGFLSPAVCVFTWAVSALVVGCCVKKTSAELDEKMIPRMGLMAAYIFTAQLITFPVPGGTSGHILGAALAAILLGPCAGILVMAVVLTAQCLLFHDGGLSTLGANIFNMGIVGITSGFLVFEAIRRMAGNGAGITAGTAASSWISVVLASVTCALELVWSCTSPCHVAVPVMAVSNAIAGLFEAFITCLIVNFIVKVRPDILYNTRQHLKRASLEPGT